MVRSSQQQAELSNLQPIHRLSGQPFRTGGQQFRHLEVHTNRPLGQSHRHRFESIDTQQGMSADNRQTGDSSVPPARFGGERDLFENNTAQHPNAGSLRSFSNRGRYVSNLKSDSSKPVPTTEKEILVGARISSGAERWAEISSDPWILGVVTSGLKLEFSSYPIQDITPANTILGASQWDICNKEIEDMIRKKAVVRTEERGFVSNVFIIPKKSGGSRPVINLKRLNTFIVYRHFKMEGVNLIKHIVCTNDWMAKLDLKDAYFSVPIHKEDHRFLQFKWKNSLFQFVCLPFGLSSAPWAFTKLMKPVVAYLRQQGIRLIIYLDDILVLNQSKERLVEQLAVVSNLLVSLGFVLNQEKSQSTPAQELEFLGLLLDSTSLSLSLPRTKQESIISSCKEALKKDRIPLKEIASILGKFTWAAWAIPFSHAH